MHQINFGLQFAWWKGSLIKGSDSNTLLLRVLVQLHQILALFGAWRLFTACKEWHLAWQISQQPESGESGERGDVNLYYTIPYLLICVVLQIAKTDRRCRTIVHVASANNNIFILIYLIRQMTTNIKRQNNKTRNVTYYQRCIQLLKQNPANNHRLPSNTLFSTVTTKVHILSGC